MPLDLADALRRHLLQHFPADRDYPRAALHADGMPPLVAAFLDRALDRWLEIERDGLRSDWFDFESPAVQEAESRFFGVLARTARVPAEAWEATLGGSIDLVVRFLTVPARALTDALFEGESDPLPTAQLRERLRLFAAYLYFPEVAAAYLDKKQPETLDPDTLFDLLDRIDRRIVQEYSPEDWLALLEPLFTLARAVPHLDGVPASLLQDFFAAKSYGGIADVLEPHAGGTVDEPTLRHILTDELGASASHESAPPETQEETEPEEPDASQEPALAEEAKPAEEPEMADPGSPDDESEERDGPADATGEPESSAPEQDEGSVPLWQRFAHDPEPTDDPETDDESAPLWKRFAGDPDGGVAAPPRDPVEAAAEHALAPSTPSVSQTSGAPASVATVEARVLGSVTGGARARFVKHLFRGDERAYATVLRTLDDTESWTEASRVIARDVFRPYKVNIYGEHAIAFTDAVEARFRD